MEKGYRVRIVRGDTQFEAEGDKRFVLDMLDRFEAEGGIPELSKTRSTTTTKQPTPGKSVSAREFIQRLGLKLHTDRAVAFGYYLEHYSGKAEFTPADVNNCYYEAKMEPSNTSQAFIQNIKRGYIMEGKQSKKAGRKTYTLTISSLPSLR